MRPACVALWLALALALAACTTPDAAATKLASGDLACPASKLTVRCSGGRVFHSHEQFRCEARGCATNAEYRCEAPLNEYGPFELLGNAKCR